MTTEVGVHKKMKNGFEFKKFEESIVHDERFLSTIISYIAILIIFLNLSITHYAVIGVIASIIYFLINGIFLGQAFFKKETTFFRLILGLLLLIMLLGSIGWLAIIIYNLDIIRLTLVLFTASTISSLLNRMVKKRNDLQ